MDFKSTSELAEVQKRIKVLKAKLNSKQKAIVRASAKLAQTEERTTIVKAHTLIGQLKLKVIQMQGQFKRISTSPSPYRDSSKMGRQEGSVMSPNDTDEL